MGLTKYKLGELIELVQDTNSELQYGPDDVKGMTITKEVIPTKANVSETDLSKFLVVHPGEFIYNPRTHGKRIGFGYNNTNDNFIIRIINNQANNTLKEHENQAFEEVLILLEDTEVPETLDWSYFAPFDGFKKLLTEMNIYEYQLMIDREGKESHTLNSAIDVGLENVTEEDSKDYVGIRMADMLVGLISRLMQSLKISLTGNYKEGKIKRTLLDFGWFAVNQRQLDLYKKLYLAICENNKYWYKTFSGIYSDDLVSFVALLQFMNHFSDADEIRKSNIEMQPEYYNAFVCESLNKRYEIMRNKLPIYPILEDDKNYFYNQRGAIVYKDISNQPMLPLHSRKNEFYVLSVGFSQNGTPLVTISENDKPICYRLPEDYGEWAMNVVGMANMGEKLFPCKVVFSLIDGRYLVDIL